MASSISDFIKKLVFVFAATHLFLVIALSQHALAAGDSVQVTSAPTSKCPFTATKAFIGVSKLSTTFSAI
jgi:hypothetical protein